MLATQERSSQRLQGRQTLDRHRRIWRQKTALKSIYGVWFEAILSALPDRGRILEIGAGPGFFSAYAQAHHPELRWLTSDIVHTPWNELVVDGQHLPLRAKSIDALVGLDLVHHLDRPAAFFAEGARVLVDGGRIAVVEPWVTPLSYPIYRWLHHEGCTLGLDPWDPFGTREAGLKDPFLGDAAVPWRLVKSTPAERWRELGFLPPRVGLLNGFAYLLSGGFKNFSLLPRQLAPILLGLDRLSQPAGALLALRAIVVWERLGSSHGLSKTS